MPSKASVTTMKFDDISIVEEQRPEIAEALLLVGFPTIGLVSSIVANHVIRQLDLKRIGYFSSRYFFPAAVVIDGIPNPPVRIYAGDHLCGPGKQCQQVIVVTSEFTPPPDMIEPLADAIMSWAARRKVSLIVTVEGVNMEGQEEGEPSVAGVASTLDARHMLKEFGIEQMRDGMVGGISGVLLHRGSATKRAVISLLVDTPVRYPGARSAAKAIEILDRMLPLIKLDPKPLYDKATEIENSIREAMSKATPKKELGPSQQPPAYM
jgi:uncharacterized protein